MQAEHLQTIQNLVKSTPILTATERDEWLELLDLMNDQQLLELERILTDAVRQPNRQEAVKPVKPSMVSAEMMPKMAGVTSLPFGAPTAKPVLPIVPQKPAVPPTAAPKPAVPAQAAQSPKTSAAAPVGSPAKPAAQAAHLPPFGHILNFPAGATMPKIFPPKVDSKTVSQKPLSPFMRRLKNVFTEKELPPADIKDLPPGVKPAPAAAPASPKPQPENVTINVFVGDKDDRSKVPGLAKAEAALNAVKPPVPPVPKAPAKPGVPPSRTDVTFELEGGPHTVSYGGEKSGDSTTVIKLHQKPSEPEVTPGLNFPGFSSKDSAKAKVGGGIIIEEEETHLNIIPKIVLEERAGDAIKLESLADLLVLSPDDLKAHATGTLLKKLRGLMGKFGYYNVLFNLEKSPLYKAYMTAGIKKMESGEGAPADGAALEQKDFERFADLLIVMQS